MSTPSKTPGQPRGDYGGFHHSGDAVFEESSLTTLSEAQALVREARQSRRPLRVRSNGHSMNGSAVPGTGDLLLNVRGCAHYRFEGDPSTGDLSVSVGAGAAVYDLDVFLRSRGYRLQLCNDGGAAAATVGGFVAAGGLGAASWIYGGFWETVLALHVVDGEGRARWLERDDPSFPWFFGSMGQLGLVYEAKIKLRALDLSDPAPYPLGESGQIEESVANWEHNVWLTLFAPEDLVQGAFESLSVLAERHAKAWRPLSRYSYQMSFKNFNPPLVYPTQADFVALGIWGNVDDQETDYDALRLLERDFMEIVTQEPRIRRYIQTELTYGEVDYAAYFGPEVWQGFLEQKRAFDPGKVFGDPRVFAGVEL